MDCQKGEIPSARRCWDLGIGGVACWRIQVQSSAITADSTDSRGDVMKVVKAAATRRAAFLEEQERNVDRWKP